MPRLKSRFCFAVFGTSRARSQLLPSPCEYSNPSSLIFVNFQVQEDIIVAITSAVHPHGLDIQKCWSLKVNPEFHT
jgi:hypothetical protein